MKKMIQFVSIVACFAAFALSTTDLDIHQEADQCIYELESEVISEVFIPE